MTHRSKRREKRAWEQRQKPVLGIGTQVKYDEDEPNLTVTEIKRNVVVFDSGLEVSHKDIEFSFDALWPLEVRS
jgi:hypothetical protein